MTYTPLLLEFFLYFEPDFWLVEMKKLKGI
jgi:hypothetical protein